MMIEQISIDLTNKCSKGCSFCYNKSNPSNGHLWERDELICFIDDCIKHGTKAISFGGGEPLEYPYIFELISYVAKKAFVSMTTNGLLLEVEDNFEKLTSSGLDKIHISIHNPENPFEVKRILEQIKRIRTATQIIPGINLLVRSNNIDACKEVYKAFRGYLDPKEIILVPMRFKDIPEAKQLLEITGGNPFQSPSCLLSCTKPSNFCSVSWDKKVNWCSFAKGKQKLDNLSYSGLLEALSKVQFQTCISG